MELADIRLDLGFRYAANDAMMLALVIEDDQTLLDLLQERLLSMGHECRKARSQAEAVELLEAYAFDYILLDLEIPSRSEGDADIAYGQNLLRKIRQMPGHSRTPVLVMTGHGLESHHLSVETMKLGATDFIGKPFGRDNPLESRIREALLTQAAERNGANENAPAKITKFNGGDLVFYDDRVELCGITVCGGKNSSIKRRVLEILREQTKQGHYRCFSIKNIADRLKLDRPGAVAEAVADFRRECRERMRDAGVDCESENVVSNQNRGYHLHDWIKVLEGIDEVEPAATEGNMSLTENQRGIIRVLEKHEIQKPRKLSEALCVPASVLVKEVDGLVKAGVVVEEGNGSNRTLKLAKNGVRESLSPGME